MKAVIVTGGMGPPEKVIRTRAAWADLVIAADSGLDTLVRFGIEPDFAVGDFDSTLATDALDQLGNERVRRYKPDKDDTDTEIAIRHARELGATEVGLIGGGGGDMAHFVAILALFDRNPPPLWWVTNDAVFTSITTRIRESGVPGDKVSFFPAGVEQCTMRSSGLRWPLDGLRWTRGSIGVSNEFQDDQIEVTMVTGRLIMVRSLEA